VSAVRLARIGTWGAILTFAILMASALLRLTSGVEAGEAHSLLPPAVETGARIAHRISAMGVAILAALALVVSLRVRPVPASRLVAVCAIVAFTLVLAMIGRYTPGYRLAAVTVVNVAAGTALACAFWWLRELAVPGRISAVAVAALALLLAQAAVGAAASSAAMWGGRGFGPPGSVAWGGPPGSVAWGGPPGSVAWGGPLHVWVAMLFVIVVAAASWQQRQRRVLVAAILSLTAAQLALGVYLVGARSPTLALAHAAVAAVLGLLLVRLMKKGSE
jgi:hypothetical protein